MKYSILYDFTCRGGKGTSVYQLEAPNEEEAKSKLKQILSEHRHLKIRKIIEIR